MGKKRKTKSRSETFWNSWSPAQQKWALASWVFIMLVGWLFMFFSARNIERDIQEHRETYTLIAPMVQEFKAIKGAARESARESVLEGAWGVTRSLNLENQLAETGERTEEDGREVVDLFYQGVSLPRLLDLVRALHTRGLKVISFKLVRSQDAADRSDVRMVLAH